MRPKNLEKEQAIRSAALQIIQQEGLENLSMQKLAKVANISPRTIYIKYRDKDDLLIKLFIDEVLGAYEAAVLENFDEKMAFTEGVKTIWLNTFHYLKNNVQAFALMQYGKSSPLLNKGFHERNISEGDFFAPIHRFLQLHIKKGTIRNFPHAVLRALLFAPVFELMKEYFDHKERPVQIITEKVIVKCSDAVVKGMMK